MNKYMKIAIDEARKGIQNAHGGPFGSCIVKDGKIIASAHNKVLLKGDATCHGEMEAIRQASKKLGTHDLTGCEIYTTGAPCPMCACACQWANISKVYYGCTITDNANIGFRDERFEKIFHEIYKKNSYFLEVDRDACLKLYEEYMNMENKINY